LDWCECLNLEVTAYFPFSFQVDDENSLEQGQKEAEDMIVEAYSALLLAFLAKERYFLVKDSHVLSGQTSLKNLVPKGSYNFYHLWKTFSSCFLQLNCS
jgi:hypothetical protein